MKNMKKHNSLVSISFYSAGIHFSFLTVKINLDLIGLHTAVAVGADREATQNHVHFDL